MDDTSNLSTAAEGEETMGNDEEITGTEGDDEAGVEEDDVEETAAPGATSSVKKRKRTGKFGKGKRGKKKSKTSAAASPATPIHDGPDPATSSSAELAEAYGMEDVELEYTDEEFQSIPTLKVLYRTVILHCNGKTTTYACWGLRPQTPGGFAARRE